MNIDIICPLFNAEKYIEPLYQSIQKQNNIDLHEIKFVLTRSKDNSEPRVDETIERFFDKWNLEINAYEDVLKRYGVEKESLINKG